MDFKKLEDFLASIEEERATISFDDVERECGTISNAYIKYRHLDKDYAFHNHIKKVGYYITSVDYENRIFCIEKSEIENYLNVTEDNTEIAEANFENNLNTRIEATYNELVSKKIRNRVSKGRATEEELLNYCVGKRAFIAATAYEHFIPNSQIIAEKDAIVQSAIEKIRCLNGEVNFDEWLKQSCRDTANGMRFGVWQKILNITLKYMYLFSVFGEYFADYAELWNKCHCPVDKIIRGIVVGKVRADGIDADIDELNNIIWNKITESQYNYFQSVISQFCELEQLESKMFFDIIYWRR